MSKVHKNAKKIFFGLILNINLRYHHACPPQPACFDPGRTVLINVSLKFCISVFQTFEEIKINFYFFLHVIFMAQRSIPSDSRISETISSFSDIFADETAIESSGNPSFR